MAIDITTFSARTRPSVRQPVFRQTNNLEAEAKASGRALAANFGAQALQTMSKEAALGARRKVKQGTDAYLFKFQEDLANSMDSADATNIMNKALTGFDEHKAGLVREAEGGLINRALVSFGRAISRTGPGEQGRVKAGILAAGAAKIEENAIGEIALDLSNATSSDQTAAVVARVLESRNALNEQFPKMLGLAKKAHEEMEIQENEDSFEAELLEIFNTDGPEVLAQFMDVPGIGEQHGLDQKQANAVISDFRTAVASQKARAKEALTTIQETTANDFLLDMSNTGVTDRPTLDDLNESLRQGRLTSTRYKSLKKMLTAPEDDDPEANWEVTRAAHAVGNGSMTLAEGEDVLFKHSPNLTTTTRKSQGEKMLGEFDKSQDTAYSRAYSRAEDQLVQPVSDFNALQQAFELSRAKAGKQERKDELDLQLKLARDRRRFELDNLRRFDDAMNAWKATNPQASPEEIAIEGTRKLLLEFSPKSLSDIRAQAIAETAGFQEDADRFELFRQIAEDDFGGIITEDGRVQVTVPFTFIREDGSEVTGRIPKSQLEAAEAENKRVLDASKE